MAQQTVQEIQPTLYDARQSSAYSVEVSGWDRAENFFVEKARLYWVKKTGQQLCLKTDLREGTVVFIRLLEAIANEDNFPIAYVVGGSLCVETNGRAVIEISRLHPKPSIRQIPEQQLQPEHAEVA